MIAQRPSDLTKITCSWCHEDLSADELESPRTDPDDDQPMCDYCYHEHYEFTCCCCCEYGDVADQHNLLVVFEEVASHGGQTRKIAPGIYRIAGDGAYFGGPLIGQGYLFGDQLQRVADLNPEMDGEGYPCGHLCLECQGHVLAQFADRCRVCLKKSASCLLVKFGSWKDAKAKKYQWTPPKIVCAECRHSHRGSWKIVAAKTKGNKCSP